MPLPSAGTLTHWIERLKEGDDTAAQHLWERYFHRLVTLARQKLSGTARAGADEEDVALSVFDSLCRGAKKGRFPKLRDRDSLWHLLVAITAHKATDLKRHEARQKRGGGRAHSASVSADTPYSRTDEPSIDQIAGREPTPDFAAQVAEEFHRLLAMLKDRSLEAVAVAKMEGYSNKEISTSLNCAPRSVERKLAVIRSIWQKEMAR
jgi:DNA-directed RNA polymerase specialized sigma24 family protein